MASSPARRIRRRRAAMTLAATGASAALLMSGITAPPANAFIDFPLLGAATCDPGEKSIVELTNSTADCDGAEPSIIATIGDQIIKLVAPDLPIGLSSLNGAAALAGNATISGTGYNTAIGVLGNATASSDYYASAAIAIGALGNASAESLFGAAVALAVGGSATAHAMPLGIVIADSIGTMDNASATALGGIAAAASTADGSEVACTALYGTASLTNAAGESQGSCTSVLFIFQKYEEGEGEPTWYAIKNPFDIELISPFGTSLGDLLGIMGDSLQLPDGALDLLAGEFIPQFQSDIVRISFDGGSPKIGSDLPKFMGGLFGQNDTSATANAPAPALEALSAPVDDAAPAVETAPVQAPASTPAPVVDSGSAGAGPEAPVDVDLSGGGDSGASGGAAGDLLSIG